MKVNVNCSGEGQLKYFRTVAAQEFLVQSAVYAELISSQSI
jgi:hypothetical protein